MQLLSASNAHTQDFAAFYLTVLVSQYTIPFASQMKALRKQYTAFIYN